ncbi:MAG: Hsp20/alpha crystallin family protein [Alphaproteobacteria bacterium]
MPLRDLTPWFGRSHLSSRQWPEHTLDSLHREVDRMFSDFFGGAGLPSLAGPNGGAERLVPKVDIAETDAAYEVTADLPGVEEKDVDVSVSDGVLRIKGERKSEKEEKKKNYHRIERSFGSFERAISLPEGIDEGKIEANFKQGVLKVTLPKSPKAKESEKKIAIKAG